MGDLKPDLGVLVIVMMLVNHPRAEELFNRMAEYKDFFLVAFFLNVGLVGLPYVSTLVISGLILPLVLFKGALFLLILSRFDLQPRTVYLSSLTLTNLSEFGLIVGVVGVSIGLMSEDWLVAMAFLMSVSFVIASPLAKYSHVIFDKFKPTLLKINEHRHTVDEEPQDLIGAKYLVVGMESIGKLTFDALTEKYGSAALGLDYKDDLVEEMKSEV